MTSKTFAIALACCWTAGLALACWRLWSAFSDSDSAAGSLALLAVLVIWLSVSFYEQSISGLFCGLAIALFGGSAAGIGAEGRARRNDLTF